MSVHDMQLQQSAFNDRWSRSTCSAALPSLLADAATRPVNRPCLAAPEVTHIDILKSKRACQKTALMPTQHLS